MKKFGEKLSREEKDYKKFRAFLLCFLALSPSILGGGSTQNFHLQLLVCGQKKSTETFLGIAEIALDGLTL